MEPCKDMVPGLTGEVMLVDKAGRIPQTYALHLSQFRNDLYQVFFVLPVHDLPSVLRYKHNMVGAIPSSMLYTPVVHLDTSYVWCGCEPTTSLP